MDNIHSILWQRLDQSGHEFACLTIENRQPTINGTALFIHDGLPCCLDYRILCDSDWRTVSAKVGGWFGRNTIAVEINVDEEYRWYLNSDVVPVVKGCRDLDLSFSPSTNLLPIRRLGLEIGQSAKIIAAWLRFPTFTLEPLPQVYRRLSESNYRYESAGGRFAAELQVDTVGFVTEYPNFWQVIAGES